MHPCRRGHYHEDKWTKVLALKLSLFSQVINLSTWNSCCVPKAVYKVSIQVDEVESIHDANVINGEAKCFVCDQ